MTDNTYKTYYDISKVVIWADDEGVSNDNGRRPRMVFGLRDGNPRVMVFTGENLPAGVITFPMDHYTFGSVLRSFKRVVDGEPGNRLSIESIGSVYKDNKPTNETRLVSTLHIGKTKDGIVYLSLIEDTKPKIVFPLKATKWHKYKDSNKEDLPEAEVSVMLAEGIIELLQGISVNMVMKYTSDEYMYGDREPGPIRGFENLKKRGAPGNTRTLTEVNSDLNNVLGDLDL